MTHECKHEQLIQDLRYTMFGKDGQPGWAHKVTAMEVVVDQLAKDINKIGDAFRSRDAAIDQKEKTIERLIGVVKIVATIFVSTVLAFIGFGGAILAAWIGKG